MDGRPKVNCAICWDPLQEGEAAVVECSLRSVSEDISESQSASWLWEILVSDDDPKPSGCPLIHRTCFSKHLILQAENGRVPNTCPSCMRKLSVQEVQSHLDADCRSRWLLLCNKWTELRTGASIRPPHELEEVLAMQSLGCAPCPKCRAWVQKEEPDMIYGCDKMTCRCGARFCFSCGSLAAACTCTPAYHDFIDLEDVLNNYSWFDDMLDVAAIPEYVRRQSGTLMESVASYFVSNDVEPLAENTATSAVATASVGQSSDVDSFSQPASASTAIEAFLLPSALRSVSAEDSPPETPATPRSADEEDQASEITSEAHPAPVSPPETPATTRSADEEDRASKITCEAHPAQVPLPATPATTRSADEEDQVSKSNCEAHDVKLANFFL